MATNLSKNYTLERTIGICRRETNQLKPGPILNEDIIDFIHLSIEEVAELLNEESYPDYGVKETVTQTSNVISLTGLENNLDRITKLVDGTNGKCIEVSPGEFEDLANDSTAINNIYWYLYGENIYLYKGSGVTAYGTLYLHFIKQPKKVTTDADTLDIRDKHVRLVIAKTKARMYESIGQTPPEALTQLIENSIAKIRGGKAVEEAVAKD